jgi:putative tryptophan/tyrosine transport system substrate-binding protein
MRRREFLSLMGSAAALVVPFFARAQQAAKVYRIAIVASAGPISDIDDTSKPTSGFLKELRRRGYIEGQNLVVDRYSAEGRPERYPQLVGDVVRSNPDAVLIYTLSLARAFKAQTTTIPIVALVVDPVAVGLAASVARPGGNFTGVYAASELNGKRLGLLKEALPKLSRVGFLAARTLVAQHGGAMLKEAAENQGISVVGSPFDGPFDETAYRKAIAAMVQEGAEAVYVLDQLENWENVGLIVELAEKRGLPAIYPMREAVQIGGFMAYEIDYWDQYLHCADAVDKILKGTKPGDIPFYQATKFYLVINLNTAKALGIDISPNLLALADEVIE